MKNAEDFRKLSLENGITFWPIYDCSMCGYGCGFMFFWVNETEVAYDSGCDCTQRYIKEIRTWEDVANQYNININNPDTINKYNYFWRFK